MIFKFLGVTFCQRNPLNPNPADSQCQARGYLLSIDFAVCLGSVSGSSWDCFINPARSLPSLETALDLAWARLPGKWVNMRSKDQGWPVFLGNQGIPRKHQAWGTAGAPEEPGETAPAPWLHLLLLPSLPGTPHPAHTPRVLTAPPYGSSTGPEPQELPSSATTGHLPQGRRGAPGDTHTWIWQRAAGSSPEHHPAQPAQEPRGDFWSFLNPPWLCLASCHEAFLYPVWAQGGNILSVQFQVFGLAPAAALLHSWPWAAALCTELIRSYGLNLPPTKTFL